MLITTLPHLPHLPHLPLQVIFGYLSFNEIILLTKIPIFRDIVKDYYHREMNKRELIQSAFLECVKMIFFEYNFEEYFVCFFKEVGMTDYYSTDEYKTLKLGFYNTLTPNEIDMMRVNKDHMFISDLFDELASMSLTKQRYHQLYDILLLDIMTKSENCNIRHTQQFMKIYFDRQNGFKRILTFVEYVYKLIYENYECILPSQDGKMIKQIDKWNTPSLYLDFIKDTNRVLKIIECIFYS